MEHDSHDEFDMLLAREVRGLDREIQPDRNLWVGIARRIGDHPQRRWRGRERWLPYGVAASLAIAVTSLVLNLIGVVDTASPEQPMPSELTASLDQLGADHASRRAPMLATFRAVNASLDQNTRDELYRNLEIMARARSEIEAQVRDNPQDRELVASLLRLQQWELRLLSEDYASPGNTL
jgi:hypothetical protein